MTLFVPYQGFEIRNVFRTDTIFCPFCTGGSKLQPSLAVSAHDSDETWNPKQLLTLSQSIDFINQQQLSEVRKKIFDSRILSGYRQREIDLENL